MSHVQSTSMKIVFSVEIVDGRAMMKIPERTNQETIVRGI